MFKITKMFDLIWFIFFWVISIWFIYKLRSNTLRLTDFEDKLIFPKKAKNEVSIIFSSSTFFNVIPNIYVHEERREPQSHKRLTQGLGVCGARIWLMQGDPHIYQIIKSVTLYFLAPLSLLLMGEMYKISQMWNAEGASYCAFTLFRQIDISYLLVKWRGYKNCSVEYWKCLQNVCALYFHKMYYSKLFPMKLFLELNKYAMIFLIARLRHTRRKHSLIRTFGIESFAACIMSLSSPVTPKLLVHVLAVKSFVFI